MTRCIYTVSYFLWLDNFFSYARFYKKFMEQWHKAMPHKAFSDLKYGTEHGTMAQDFKIYGTEHGTDAVLPGFRRLPLSALLDCVCFVYSLLVSPSIIAV